MPPMTYNGQPQERGVALLIVLLLITVMSTVAYAVTDDIRFAVRRAANTQISSQMSWYALGAETMARKVLWSNWRLSPQRSTLSDPWARQGVTFPIEGGAISGRISDAGTCFNLNSVVERGPSGKLVESETGRKQFVALLTAVDIDRQQAQALAGALTDWTDSDSAPSGYGAEDDVYSLRDIPYRTGSTLLAEPSELRAIAGFNEEIYQRLRPLVCALPSSDLTRLNVNTIRPDQAALIVMLAGGEVRLAEVERLIAGRPAGGFASVDSFLASDIFAGLQFDQVTRGQFTAHTRYFMAESTVQLHAASTNLSSLIEVNGSGDITVHARRYGAFD